MAFTVMVGTLAVTACGTIHASGSSGAASGTSSGHTAASPAQAPGALVEAYTVPNANPRLDGSVYGPQMITPGHTYRLPVINPDPVAGALPRGFKGIASNPSPGQVLAMIRTASGHLIALASTGRGAAITDLSTGHSRPLVRYGQLGGDVYLFGGPAKNQVSRLIISAGALTRNMPSLRAPATSWVVAVSAA